LPKLLEENWRKKESMLLWESHNMRAKLILLSIIIFITGSTCLKPIRFRAIIEAYYKDQYIRCEEDVSQAPRSLKTICKIADDFEVLSQPGINERNGLDLKFIIRKKNQVLAEPMLILNTNKPTKISTEKGNKKITIEAQRLP
jgi:hypothetical protein